jgi:hypothetical protein
LRLRGARLTFPGTPGWQSLRRLFADLNQNAPPPTTPALTRGRGGSAKISQPSIPSVRAATPKTVTASRNVASKLQSHDSACPDIRVTRRVKHVKACFFQRVYLILSYILSYQGFVSSSSRSPHPVFSSRNLSIYLSIPAIRSLRHLVPSRLPCRVTSTSSTVMRTTVTLLSLPIASGHWPTLVWHSRN